MLQESLTHFGFGFITNSHTHTCRQTFTHTLTRTHVDRGQYIKHGCYTDLLAPVRQTCSVCVYTPNLQLAPLRFVSDRIGSALASCIAI